MLAKGTFASCLLLAFCVLPSAAHAQSLIEFYRRALENNPTLRTREFNIEQARAQEDLAASRLLPRWRHRQLLLERIPRVRPIGAQLRRHAHWPAGRKPCSTLRPTSSCRARAIRLRRASSSGRRHG